MKGKLIIICAPSGTGKTSILKAILPLFPSLEFSISACSRNPRESEIHGKDYYFLTKEEFKEKINKGAFLEWEEVYPGSYYGTLVSEIDRIWANEKNVIFDVDVMGGLQIKRKYPDQSLAIFIKPPSLDALEKRLLRRGTETEDSIRTRLDKAEFEMEMEEDFDVSVVNDVFDTAVAETSNIIRLFLENKRQ